MGKRGVMATTLEEVAQLSPAELDRQIAVAQWRLGAATKSTLRNRARKTLRMLENAQAERRALQDS